MVMGVWRGNFRAGMVASGPGCGDVLAAGALPATSSRISVFPPGVSEIFDGREAGRQKKRCWFHKKTLRIDVGGNMGIGRL
jgi:hypothetical protein